MSTSAKFDIFLKDKNSHVPDEKKLFTKYIWKIKIMGYRFWWISNLMQLITSSSKEIIVRGRCGLLDIVSDLAACTYEDVGSRQVTSNE